MERFSIVNYDGGFAVNLSDYGDERTFDVNSIKWFETKEAAEQFAAFSKFAESGEAYADNAPEFVELHYLDDSDAPELDNYGADGYAAYLPLCNLAFYVVPTDGATEAEEIDPNSDDQAKIDEWLESLKS